MWIEDTKDITVGLGSSVTIHCIARGSPKPQVVLKKIFGKKLVHLLKHIRFICLHKLFLIK